MEATTVRKRGELEELELGRMQQAQKRRTCRTPTLLRQIRIYHGTLGSRCGRNCNGPNHMFVGSWGSAAVLSHSYCRQAGPHRIPIDGSCRHELQA